MVNEKQTKRERNIKSKLMAAIAMLLVSSIMMVSTTYAWFTLSTAPEVTGITTAVGANGNLEMALLPAVSGTTTGDDGKTVNTYYATATEAMNAIASSGTDSFAATNDKTKTNITWGNLVDLDHTSYGMSKIVLYPSTLNASSDGLLTEGEMLSIPVYGADGRVADMSETGYTGTFDGTDSFYNETGFGVRAVGKVSGLSAREQAYNSAKNQANSAASRANKAASASLQIGGNALASLAMKHAQDKTATFTDAEIKPLADTYAHLLAQDGAISEIETALKQYIIANVVATSKDEEYAAKITAINALSMEGLKEHADDATDAVIGKIIDLRTEITAAKASIESQITSKDEHAWTDVYNALKILGDTETMKLNGYVLDYWMGKQDAAGNAINVGIRYTELFAIMNNLTLVLEKPAVVEGEEEKDPGIYVKMADFCGQISATVEMVVEYQGNDIPLAPTMVAKPTVTPSYLATAKTNLTAYAKDSTSTVKNPISDFYGYIVDLAFRTNAVDSHLKLQTTPEDRIYTGNTSNPDTMGSGSTMSYSYNVGGEYNGNNVKSLMNGIRVVFFDPTDYNKIVAYAKLDMANVSQEEIKDTDGKVTGYTLTANLKLTDAKGDFLSGAGSDKLIDLNQNITTALSALVYLEGSEVENSAISNTAIQGTMNLQFSSSAELKPMSYTDLQNGTATTESGTGSEG